jgi:2-dehydropantoate 2-reductase
METRTWSEQGPFPPKALLWITCKAAEISSVLEDVVKRTDGTQSIILCQNGIGVGALAKREWERLGGSSMTLFGRAVFWLGARLESPPTETDDGGRLEPYRLYSGGHIRGVEIGSSSASVLTEMRSIFKTIEIKLIEQQDNGWDLVEWRKVLWNASTNAIGALAECKNRGVIEDVRLRLLCRQLYAEAHKVASREGVKIPASFENVVWEAAREVGENYNSMLQDLWAGRKTELPWLNGEIAAAGKRVGVPTPGHDWVVALISALESSGARARTWSERIEKKG